MLSNQTDLIYHTRNQMSLGNEIPCNLKKAQQEQNVLYNGNVLFSQHDPICVRDSVATIEIVEQIRNKMKQKNPDLKPIDYNKLNKQYGLSFVPQKPTTVISKNRGISKIVSKLVVASKSHSNMEQMSSNNTFNTSEARRCLDDLKKELKNFKCF